MLITADAPKRSQEQEEDDDGQHRAEKQILLDQVERTFDVFDLVGDDFDLQALAAELLAVQPVDHFVELAGHLEHVRARLAGKQHHHGRPVVNDRDADRFAKRQLHGGHVAEENRGAIAACSEHDFLERGRRFRRDGGAHQVASLAEGHVAPGQIAELASHSVGHPLHRKPAGCERLRVEQHVDLGVLTAEEEDARHARDAIDFGQNLVLDPSPVGRHAAAFFGSRIAITASGGPALLAVSTTGSRTESG